MSHSNAVHILRYHSAHPPFGVQRLLLRPASLLPEFRRDISLSAAHGKGHSHWQNTKDTKAKMDAIKSKGLNDVMARIKQAVKDGYDPAKNKKLQDIMSDMRKQSLPLDRFRAFLEKVKQQNEAAGGEKS